MTIAESAGSSSRAPARVAQLLRRPLLLALILGCAVSVLASGIFTLRLIVDGALSMAFGVELSAPHGGIFVLFAVDGVIGFFVALIAGMLVSAAAVIALRGIHVPGDAEVDEPVAAAAA